MNPDDMNPDDLEHRLREALHQEAARITPRERRTEILAMTQHENQHEDQHKKTVEKRRRWLIPAAAAASVALIGTAVWGVSSTGGGQQASQIAATPTSSSAPTSTSTGSATSAPAVVPPPNPSPTATSSGSVAGSTTQLALPAYFVGASSAAGKGFGLYREFVRTTVPLNATPAQKAKAAVAVAMDATAFASVEPYLQPWSATSVRSVAVTPSRITITLSGPGASGLTAEQSKLAVQQLVWTAQAAVSRAAVPVKFVIASGQAKLFGIYPTTATYNRPAADLQFEVLAPIWITTPIRDQVFRTGVPVVAAGQSCAFEGTTQWQLKKSGTTVRSGTATASSGCPTRGTWQVRLGTLGAGSYTFRMYEVSMEDGTVIAETAKPFTVR